MKELFLLVLLSTGLVANVAWTVYLFRKNKLNQTSSTTDLVEVEARAERLLTEIHRVTSANVEFLEGRIEALKEVGGLADERLKRIRSSLTDLEVLLNRVHRVKKSLGDASSGDPALETSGVELPGNPPIEEKPSMPAKIRGDKTRSESVMGLYRQGFTEKQIAQKMGLGIAEIRFLLKLSNMGETPRARPVESK